MEGLSRTLASWATNLTFDDLPDATIAAAKVRLLDTLAVGWAGSNADGIEPVRQMLVAQGGRADATVWAHGDKLPAGNAALLNSAMAAALDFDGLHETSGVHTDISVLPAAFALAEREGSSGQDFITALAAGEEILIRLGLSVDTGPGWFFSSVFGVFGAAIAAAKILKLDTDATNAAIGTALCLASGSQQNLAEDALTKRYQSGFAAQAGVLAAEMAAAGVGGPEQALEGKFALSTLYGPLDTAVIVDGLGEQFHMNELTLKKYPSCFCNHAAIDGVLQLIEHHGITADAIETISVQVSPFMAKLVGGPFEAATATQVTAQFSLPYSIACALLRRRFTLDDIQVEAIRDAEVEALASRVEIEVDESNLNRFLPVDLGLRGTDGTVFETHVSTLPGTPAAPLSDADIDAKARQCLGMGVRPLGPETAGDLMARIGNLETLTGINALFAP